LLDLGNLGRKVVETSPFEGPNELIVVERPFELGQCEVKTARASARRIGLTNHNVSKSEQAGDWQSATPYGADEGNSLDEKLMPVTNSKGTAEGGVASFNSAMRRGWKAATSRRAPQVLKVALKWQCQITGLARGVQGVPSCEDCGVDQMGSDNPFRQWL